MQHDSAGQQSTSGVTVQFAVESIRTRSCGRCMHVFRGLTGKAQEEVRWVLRVAAKVRLCHRLRQGHVYVALLVVYTVNTLPNLAPCRQGHAGSLLSTFHACVESLCTCKDDYVCARARRVVRPWRACDHFEEAGPACHVCSTASRLMLTCTHRDRAASGRVQPGVTAAAMTPVCRPQPPPAGQDMHASAWPAR